MTPNGLTWDTPLVMAATEIGSFKNQPSAQGLRSLFFLLALFPVVMLLRELGATIAYWQQILVYLLIWMLFSAGPARGSSAARSGAGTTGCAAARSRCSRRSAAGLWSDWPCGWPPAEHVWALNPLSARAAPASVHHALEHEV